MKNKNIIFGFILGLIVCGVIGVGATYLYTANQVSYKDSNVNTVLNELYNNLNKKYIKTVSRSTAIGETQYVSLDVDNMIVGREYTIFLELLEYSASTVYLDDGINYQEIDNTQIFSYTMNGTIISRKIYKLTIKPQSTTITFNMHAGTEYDNGKYSKSVTAIIMQ